MKKRISIILFMVILSQSPLLPVLSAEARAETRIYITFAAGGVVGGLYFFLRFVFQAKAAMPGGQIDTSAIFNHGPEGWQIKYPSLHLTAESGGPTVHLAPAPEITQVEILKIRF